MNAQILRSTPTENVTLNTWSVWVGGEFQGDIEIDSFTAGKVRDMIAGALATTFVELRLTAHERGILLDLMAAAEKAARPFRTHDCGGPGRPVQVAECGDCWDVDDERFAGRF